MDFDDKEFIVINLIGSNSLKKIKYTDELKNDELISAHLKLQELEIMIKNNASIVNKLIKDMNYQYNNYITDKITIKKWRNKLQQEKNKEKYKKLQLELKKKIPNNAISYNFINSESNKIIQILKNEMKNLIEKKEKLYIEAMSNGLEERLQSILDNPNIKKMDLNEY